MTETTIGREPVQIVELVQPKCTNTFGVAPCTAVGMADQKCFNTRATCRDDGGAATNFALGTPLSLYFSTGAVASRGVSGAAYIIPSLVSVSTAPTRINIAGANPDAQGLGNRAIVSVTLADHPHSDEVVDPYVSGRTYDPMTRASFWTKWLARNKYRQSMEIRVYEGYSGQALSAMKKRTYFLQEVTPPDASGRITISGKDILARVEDRKAKAPALSPGKLYADITAGASSIEAANATAADYDASGIIRIGSELIVYTSRANSANGVTFSGLTRGAKRTAAAAHDANDGVQQCLQYVAQRVDDVIEDLLTTYGGVPSAWLDTVNWAAEIDEYLSLFPLDVLITEPTSVSQLVSEVQENAMVYVWWDERDALVKLKAVRGIDVQPDLLTEENHIIADSFALSERPRERASQVWVYYKQFDATKSRTDPTNYKSSTIIADLESETDAKHGEPSVRVIFARWLNSEAVAATTASKIITQYVDVPSECTFQLDAKDRGHWVGDTVTISHHLDVDAYGVRRLRNWTIVSAEEIEPGHIVQYQAEDTTLTGRIHYVMANGAADYPGYVTAPFKNCYIGNSSGFLSDGETCGRIN